MRCKSAGAGAPAVMWNHSINEQKYQWKFQANECNTYNTHCVTLERMKSISKSVFEMYFIPANHAHACLMASDKMACDANLPVQLRTTRRRFISTLL
jgi:hypothetical protein